MVQTIAKGHFLRSREPNYTQKCTILQEKKEEEAISAGRFSHVAMFNSPEPLMVLPGIMVFANKFSANGEYL
jgi:hypothetical protein